MKKSLRLIGLALIFSCATAGCSGPGKSGSTADGKTMTVRNDLDPLTKRFPAIGRPVAADWITWNNSSDRSVGPTTYWLQAIIQLEPGVANDLRTKYQPAEPATPAGLQEKLLPHLPSSAFKTSRDFGDLFKNSEGWQATAYLQDDGNYLILDATDPA
ncbi:hypothetical protein ACWDOP_38715 [Nocardia sp. NPDC003693]